MLGAFCGVSLDSPTLPVGHEGLSPQKQSWERDEGGQSQSGTSPLFSRQCIDLRLVQTLI